MSQQEPTSPEPAEQGQDGDGSGRSGIGWKIATGLLAVTTVGSLTWGISSTNDLQAQVDALNATVSSQ